MSGVGRQERLDLERRLRQATTAVKAVHEATGPLAQVVQRLDQLRTEDLAKQQELNEFYTYSVRLWERERRVLSGSILARLWWLVTGRL